MSFSSGVRHMRKGTNQTRYYKKQIISNRITSIPVWWCRLLVGEWYLKRPRFNSLTSPLQLRPQPHPRLLQYVRQFDSKSKNKYFIYPFLIPADCTWKYFSCTSHSSRCKAEFRKCSDGKSRKYSMMIFLLNFQLQIPFFPSADNEICASVAENPQNYLVPHPTDCTKFFSCQSLGHNRGWIAHLMDCPATTGFDTKLRICNYIKSLPRCSNEGTVHLQLQYKPHHRGLVTKLCVLYPNSMPGIPLHLSFKYSELPQ